MAETRFILKQIPNGPETAIVGVTTVGRNEDNTPRLAETKVSRYQYSRPPNSGSSEEAWRADRIL